MSTATQLIWVIGKSVAYIATTVPAATYLVFNLVSEAVPATALVRRM